MLYKVSHNANQESQNSSYERETSCIMKEESNVITPLYLAFSPEAAESET